MYEALGKARDMFKLYAELHRAKGTVDSDAKAKVNEDMVAIMNEALSELRQGGVPHPGSPEASAMIDSVLAEYGWPAYAKNAARAGYEAARRLAASPPPPTKEKT